MKLVKINASLTTRISVVVTSVVILTLAVLGIYFERFLQQTFIDDATQRMQHGYRRLSFNLRNIEAELQDGILLIKNDKFIRSSIDLINNYQDKNNYNAYLIDEEKKTLALKLLNQVKLSFNNTIGLYDQNKELIAYARQGESGYKIQFLSFADGKTHLYSRGEEDQEYVGKELSAQSQTLKFRDSGPKQHLQSHPIMITYHNLDGNIRIKAHLTLRDENTERPIAYIELSKLLDQAYFEQLSKDLDIHFTPSFDRKFSAYAGTLGQGLDVGTLNVIQSGDTFKAAMKRDSKNGPLYFVISLNKTKLNAILNKNRAGFFFLLLIVAIVTLLLMRSLIRRNVTIPLAALMGQIHKIEQQDYALPDPIATGDELQVISDSVNQLAFAVQERETSLQKSQDILKREIFEHQQAETQIQKLSQAVEQSSATVVITDLAGSIEYVNRKFFENTGYTFEDVKGKNSRLLKSGHTSPEEYKELWDTISSGQEWRGEFHNKRKDGSFFWEAASISPIKSQDGKIINYLAIKEDITLRKEDEDALILAKETAEFANRVKSNFLANMSHELRTPLNAIIGFSQMLKDQTFGSTGSEQNQEYVGLINDSGQHLLEIISDILDLSKIEAGQETIQESNIILQVLADECLAMIEGSAPRPKPSLELNIPNDMPALRGDFLKIKQILLNLISNAVKFTPETGSVIVAFSVNENDAIEMKVTDTGMGIAAADIPKVTNPFEQLADAHRHSKEGTGLGLALSKRLVELHDGLLHIESTLGKGTTVFVTFPPERTIGLISS